MSNISNTRSSAPLGQSLTPTKSKTGRTLLMVVAIVLALILAVLGFLETRRTERVLIAARAIPFGQQITADDLKTIEVPLHRPADLAGVTNPNLIIGLYAARMITEKDLFQPAMALPAAPDTPVYPSGEILQKNMVALPFSVQAIGPITNNDLVNIGFNDATGNQAVCTNAGGTVAAGSAPSGDDTSNAYACRMIERANVLYVDAKEGMAYLEVPPYQALAVQAVRAADMMLWAERYGSSSVPLTPLDRLSPRDFSAKQLVAPTAEPTVVPTIVPTIAP